MPTIPPCVSGVAEGSPWMEDHLTDRDSSWFVQLPYWFLMVFPPPFLTLVWAARVVEKSTESAKPASYRTRIMVLRKKTISLRVARPDNSVCIYMYIPRYCQSQSSIMQNKGVFNMLILLIFNVLIVTRQSDFPWLSHTVALSPHFIVWSRGERVEKKRNGQAQKLLHCLRDADGDGVAAWRLSKTVNSKTRIKQSASVVAVNSICENITNYCGPPCDLIYLFLFGPCGLEKNSTNLSRPNRPRLGWSMTRSNGLWNKIYCDDLRCRAMPFHGLLVASKTKWCSKQSLCHPP